MRESQTHAAPEPLAPDVRQEEHDVIMRRFIRHPSGIPIAYDVVECGRPCNSSSLVNISRGGLCFNSDVELSAGTLIHIEIPVDTPPFELEGAVAWCKPEGDHFVVGLAFQDSQEAYAVRMVEQVCYIEHYRRSVAELEGRVLSSEDAAAEWVSKYAADFHHH